MAISQGMRTLLQEGLALVALQRSTEAIAPLERALEIRRKQDPDGTRLGETEFALARVGPTTVAIGSEKEVAALARVRLGIDPDLKISGPLLETLQSLKESSTIRLVSREPAKLGRMFAPMFNNELTDNCDLFALSLTLQTPVKARLVLKAKSAQAAGDLAARIRNEPQRLLKLADSDLLLYAQPPDVEVQGANVQLRFDVPENSARLILQRLAKVTPAPAVAAD